jgi:hypothetical protein
MADFSMILAPEIMIPEESVCDNCNLRHNVTLCRNCMHENKRDKSQSINKFDIILQDND